MSKRKTLMAVWKVSPGVTLSIPHHSASLLYTNNSGHKVVLGWFMLSEGNYTIEVRRIPKNGKLPKLFAQTGRTL